jgi:hypothetical protein
MDTCRTFNDADRLKNSDAVIIGRLQKFAPWEKGKGAGHMFWQWEIKLSDGFAIPVVNKNKTDGDSIVFDQYENRDVVIHGTVYYGIIIGDSSENKIKIDLIQFNNEGYRVYPNGEKSSAYYEFCIPANDSILAVVKSIDPEASEMKGSMGRSGCSDQEWLVISSTRKTGFKDIIRKLAELEYIRQITETFWE